MTAINTAIVVRERNRDRIIMYDEIALYARIEKLKLNREAAQEFDMRAMREGLSIRRRFRYLSVLNLMNKVLHKDIHVYTQDDIDTFFFWMREHTYSDETKRCTWLIFRKIVRHFRKLKFGEYKAFLVKKYKYPKNILKRDMIIEMLKRARTTRERLIVSMLYNSGCRPDEFLKLKRPDVTIDLEGTIFHVRGKTGERIFRIVYIIDCEREFISYLSTIEGNCFLFNFGIKRLTDILTRIRYEAGIEHRVTPYTFRHSSATFMANYMMPAQMCAYFGWVQGSEMPAIYIHMAGSDISRKITDINQLLRENESGDAIYHTIQTPRREQLSLLQLSNRATSAPHLLKQFQHQIRR